MDSWPVFLYIIVLAIPPGGNRIRAENNIIFDHYRLIIKILINCQRVLLLRILRAR